MEPEDKDPTIETAGDKAHLGARALIAAIPVLGGPALEIFNSLFVPPLEKRKVKWMKRVSEAIVELQEKYDLEIEKLAENEHFISILLHASSIAIKNHQEEKISALKKVLINSATEKSTSEDQQFAFLNLINDFTPTHLKFLYDMHKGFCWSPIVSTQGHKVDVELSRLLLREYKELRGQGDFIYQVINDLNSKNLLNTFSVSKFQQLPNGEFSVIGVSEWGQIISLKPGNCNHLNLESKLYYLTIPTKLGVSFLNYIYSSEEEHKE